MPNSEPAVDDVIPPSIYVDETLLRTHDREVQLAVPKVAYRIDEDIFHEDRLVDADKLVEFEVYAEKVTEKMDNDYDMYCSTPTDSGSEYADDQSEEPLQVSLQNGPNGFIINNNCFLTWQQWHTIIPTTLSSALVECLVCSQYCEEKDSLGHVASRRHVEMLENTPPLARFDLCVVRKIGNHYHCAVCNELFKIDEETEHFSGKTHEGNLLFAINKSSDILDQYASTKLTENDTYHYKSIFDDDNEKTDNHHFINFQNHLEYDDEEILTSEFSYANIAKKPKTETQKYLDIDLGSKKVKVKFDSWHMVISPKLNRFWCMVCKKFDHVRNKLEHCKETEHLRNLAKCHVVEAYEEYFIRQVDDKLYHCGHCNNLQMIHEMIDHVEVNHPRKTKIVLDNKRSNNSPLKTAKDRKSSICDDISDKSSVCSDKNSKISDKNGKFSDKNGKISDKNYTVNIKNVTQANMKTSVSINNNTNQGMNKDTNKTNLPKTDHALNGTPVFYAPNNNIPATENKMAANNSNIDTGRNNLDIFKNIIISPFGPKTPMTLPVMAYNIICKRPSDFYCGLCNVLCAENDIGNHIYDLKHVELLQRTPFIRPFGCHLIRAIRDALHCAICNMPIAVDKIDIHSQDPQHLASLSRALNTTQIPSTLPPIGVKIPNVPTLPNLSIPLNMGNIPSNMSNIPSNMGNITSNMGNIPSNMGNMPLNIPNMSPRIQGQNQMSPTISPNIHNLSPNSNTPSPYHTPSNMSPRLTPTHLKVLRQNGFHEGLNKPNDNVKNFEAKKLFDSATKLNATDNSLNNQSQAFNNEDLHSPTTEENFETPDDMSEDFDKTFDSVASEDATFDFEETVYLKLKNSYIKISNTSYNTLVSVGDGSRYCFVCSLKVKLWGLQKHVDSRSHLDNIEKYRFLDKYEDHLLRQIYLMYHCAICNVIITRKDLKTHLEWPTHVLLNDNTIKNLKKTRKNEIKGGIKQIIVSTQKENIYLHNNETKIKICLDVTLKDDKLCGDTAIKEFSHKNKIIIFNDNVLKVSWEAWQGITKIKNGHKCVLCQKDLKEKEIESHCNIQWHKYSLDKPFEKRFAPALIRKINESTLNCLFCNTEVSNKPATVAEHVNGKKHLKNYEAILKDSSMANTYTDCQDDVLML